MQSSSDEEKKRADSDLEKVASRRESNSKTDLEDEQSSTEDKLMLKKSRGVLLIESVKDLIKGEGGQKAKWLLIFSILLLTWGVSLDLSTTTNYEVPATSYFNHHTLVSTLGIATKIINAAGQLFFAKFSDVTSRPTTYAIALMLYVIGYIIIPSSSSISSYIVGNVFGKLGRTIINLTNVYLVGDLTPLKWRCFGIATLSAPNIVTPFFSGLIVNDILASNWKWGYGMFVIIVPVCLIPGLTSLYYYQSKALKLGIVQEKSEKYGIRVSNDTKGWVHILYQAFMEVDVIGIVLLAFALSLILLPLSLYKSAENQWRNPSIIAMFIVGGVILGMFVVYEIYYAPYPCMHKLNFNRTVITEVVFNLFYFMSSMLRETYLSSFVWVIKDWNNRDWTYFNSTIIVTKSFFGLIVGLLHRTTHRYKYLQIIGICIEIIAAGVWVSVKSSDSAGTGKMVILQVLLGLGGSMSVYSSRTAIQAAVPHQNMTVAYSTLMLFSSIGSAIGSAVASAIWNDKTPANLRKYMPESISDTQVMSFFKNLNAIRQYPMGSEVREAAVKAYCDTVFYLFVPSLGILFISFLVCFAQKNYYLGDGQNAVEAEEIGDSSQDRAPILYKKFKTKLNIFSSSK